MNKDLIINQIKEQMKSLMKFSEAIKATDQNFTEVKTMDGKVLVTSADKIDLNVEVFTIDEKGNQTPAEDGDYSLEDGSIVTLKGGVVVKLATKDGEVKEAESPIEDASVNAAKEEEEKKKKEEDATNKSKELKAEDVVVDEEAPKADPLEDRISALELQLGEILELLQSLTTSSADMSKKVEAFSKAPAEKLEAAFLATRELSKEELRMERINSMVKKQKNK